MKLIDLTGQTFSLLTVIQREENSKHGHSMWKCRCVCGNETIVLGSNLVRSHTTSCGCFSLKSRSLRSTTHGMTDSKEYSVWNEMNQRCSNPKSSAYYKYGSRGIKVCERWKNFENFIADMGMRPADKPTIERVNNNGNYEPGNCIWATRKTNTRNRRCTLWVTLRGEMKTLAEWCEILGAEYCKTQTRISRGWNPERAFLP